VAEPIPALTAPTHELDHLAEALVRCLADVYRRGVERAEQNENAPLAGGARVEVRDDSARPSG
jgi:hypothetical protein